MILEEDVKKTFAGLVAIDSPSLGERAMAQHIKAMFAELGVELAEDESGTITGSDAGNLHGYIRGGLGNPILLSAHMDTVMPARGKKAVFHPDGRITSDGTTVLGADDLAGVTAIYEAVRYLIQSKAEHRDVELLFTTGEELYCKGAKAFDYGRLQAKSALVLDLSGSIGTAAYAAPTILSFEVTVIGKAAHAGFCPEDGINAVRAVCEAVAKLPQGHIDEVTTANIGILHGGDGINIVPERCTVRGEIRSLQHQKAIDVAQRYKEVFAAAAGAVGAKCEWTQQVDIKAYETATDSAVVADYRRACESLGITVSLQKTFGGSDNNVYANNGLEGIVIATSMNDVHSCKEYAHTAEIVQVVEILLKVCMGVIASFYNGQ